MRRVLKYVLLSVSAMCTLIMLIVLAAVTYTITQESSGDIQSLATPPPPWTAAVDERTCVMAYPDRDAGHLMLYQFEELESGDVKLIKAAWFDQDGYEHAVRITGQVKQVFVNRYMGGDFHLGNLNRCSPVAIQKPTGR